MTPFVNGLEYYADLLAKLKDAADAGAGGGLHLVGGWQTVVDAQLARRDDGETAAEHPVTLLEAVALLSDEGGAARVLSPQFFQFESQSTLQLAEIIIVSLLVIGPAARRERQRDPLRRGRNGRPRRRVRGQRGARAVDHQRQRAPASSRTSTPSTSSQRWTASRASSGPSRRTSRTTR